MATLFPERLPQSILDDPKRSAERKVYDALAGLDDLFTVYYSVAWQGRDGEYGVQAGEADFVIAHPKFGMLVLEVKGGRVFYEASSQQWFTIDRYDVHHALGKDPVHQAIRSAKELSRKLQSMPGWGSQWVAMGHGVCFPDVEYGEYPLRPDLPPEIVISGSALAIMPARIQEIFSYYAKQNRRKGELGYPRLEIVDRLLARSFKLETPLGLELSAEETRLIELTEQQMGMLDFLTYHRRVAIEGCAGSGKTMLAVRKAQHLADQGFRVLLTCFNAGLGNHLARIVKEGVSVFHFHGLCRHYIDEHGVAIRPLSQGQSYYDEQLPDMLLEVLDEIGPQFDAIIVDEGQDFKENWWLPLSMLLKEHENGLFYVFFDDNQNLYQGMKNIPGVVDAPPYALHKNCRNTAHIHQVVAQFHSNPGSLQSLGPQGRPPVWAEYWDDRELERLLGKILHDYLEEGKIASGNLVVLTPHGKDKTVLADGKKVGKYTLVHREPRHSLEVQVCSIHAFKGLESQVVILAELDRHTPNLNEVLYVGASRARSQLVFCVQRAFGGDLKARLQNLIEER